MKGIIKKKEEIAKDTLLVEFELDRDINFFPGQYFFITLLNPLYRDEKGSMRHFTIVNSPHEKGIICMATRIGESAFKKSLLAMPTGAEIKIDQIYGDFILPAKFSFSLVFIALDMGITPFISMLRCLEYRGKKHKITLIYVNRNQESAAFWQELEKISKKNKNFKLIMTFINDDKWKGENRMIDENFLKEYLSSYRHKMFYIAGPPAMVESVEVTLLDWGVKKRAIKKENFSGY